MKYNIVDAIRSLCPNSPWKIQGVDYKTLNWLDSQVDKPSKAALEAEVLRLNREWERQEYQRKRKAEYPPIEDYLDAVVKGDATAIQRYTDACLAVKAKYPKPE